VAPTRRPPPTQGSRQGPRPAQDLGAKHKPAKIALKFARPVARAARRSPATWAIFWGDFLGRFIAGAFLISAIHR